MKNELNQMLSNFYQSAMNDTEIGHYFARFHDPEKLQRHLVQLTEFWCRVLGLPGFYQGDPFRIHQQLNAQSPFSPNHFHRWLLLFGQSADQYLEPVVAAEIKDRAKNIALGFSQRFCGA